MERELRRALPRAAAAVGAGAFSSARGTDPALGIPWSGRGQCGVCENKCPIVGEEAAIRVRIDPLP